mgnify:CR=1 FL=1
MSLENFYIDHLTRLIQGKRFTGNCFFFDIPRSIIYFSRSFIGRKPLFYAGYS